MIKNKKKETSVANLNKNYFVSSILLIYLFYEKRILSLIDDIIYAHDSASIIAFSKNNNAFKLK
jgi:hypothetical protein